MVWRSFLPVAIVGRLGQHEALEAQKSAVQPPELIDLQKVNTCVHHNFAAANRLASLGGIYLGACRHSCHMFSALLHPLLLRTDLPRPTISNLGEYLGCHKLCLGYRVPVHLYVSVHTGEWFLGGRTWLSEKVHQPYCQRLLRSRDDYSGRCNLMHTVANSVEAPNENETKACGTCYLYAWRSVSGFL